MSMRVADPVSAGANNCRRKIDVPRTINMINRHLFSLARNKVSKQDISNDKSNSDLLKLKSNIENSQGETDLDLRKGKEQKPKEFQSSPLIKQEEYFKSGDSSLHSFINKNYKNVNVSVLSDCSDSGQSYSFERKSIKKNASSVRRSTESGNSSASITKENKIKSIFSSTIKDVLAHNSSPECIKKYDREKQSMDISSEENLSDQSSGYNFKPTLSNPKSHNTTANISSTRSDDHHSFLSNGSHKRSNSRNTSIDSELTINVDSSWCSFAEEDSEINFDDNVSEKCSISEYSFTRKRSKSSASLEDREISINAESETNRPCITEDKYLSINDNSSWSSSPENGYKSNFKSQVRSVPTNYKRTKLSISQRDEELTINDDSSWHSFTEDEKSSSPNVAGDKYTSKTCSLGRFTENNSKINEVLDNKEISINVNSSWCSSPDKSFDSNNEYYDAGDSFNTDSSWCSYTNRKLKDMHLKEDKDLTISENSYWQSSSDNSDIGTPGNTSLLSDDSSLFNYRKNKYSPRSGDNSFDQNTSSNSFKYTRKRDSTESRYSPLDIISRKERRTRSLSSNDSGIFYELKESSLRRKLLKRIMYSSPLDIDTIYEHIDRRIIGKHDDWIHSCRRKIFLLGDSHTRFLVHGLQHIFPGFAIEAVCKPSAKSEQVITGMEESIESLTKDDFLILLCGTNDTWGECIESAKDFIYRSLTSITNTNVILCNLPRNYSVPKNSHVQENILKFNKYLARIVKHFTNIALVKLHKLKEKTFFTKHGLHFNVTGKIKICELISHKLVDVMDEINH